MNSKTLLVGIASFILGGLTVATAAATINKPAPTPAITNNSAATKNTTMGGKSIKSMAAMNHELTSKTGDAFDKAFLADMIDHHLGAIDMAKQSAAKAKHDEIKQLSNDIITAQQAELVKMEQWQRDWGYTVDASKPSTNGMDNMRMNN